MDPSLILADAQAVVTLASSAVLAGIEAAPFISMLYDILVGQKPLSDQQRADLVTQQQALSAQLQAADPA